MKITDVRIYPVDKNKILATASVTFDNCFVVKDIKILTGPKGNFVSMPSRKVGENFQDICFPSTKEFRQELTTTILDKYEESNELPL